MSTAVRVAVDRLNPPFCRLDPAGELEGFSIDLIRASLDAAGADADFVPVDGPMAQIMWLAAGRVDVAADITITERRRSWFAFSNWYHLEELMIFGRRDGPLWPGFRAFHGRLAVKVNSYVQEFLIRHYPMIPLVAVDSTEAELEALWEGRASHIAATRETGLALIEAEQAADLVGEGSPFGPAPLALAALVDQDRQIIDRFNRGLAHVRRSGIVTQLERRWLTAFAHT